METTRQSFLNERNRKNGGTTKLNFSNYKYDKEKIEEYLKEKLKKKVEKEKSNKIPNKSYSIEQPIMRFKPRTDLERIYYSVNDHTYGKIPKNVIDEQLKKFHLNDCIKKEVEEKTKKNSFLERYKNLDEKTLIELEAQYEFLLEQGYHEKNSDTVKQIKLILEDNKKSDIPLYGHGDEDENSKTKQDIKNEVNCSTVKKFMGEYNRKTFFKGASVFSYNLEVNKKKMIKNKIIQKNFLDFTEADKPNPYEDNNKYKIEENFNMKNNTNLNFRSIFLNQTKNFNGYMKNSDCDNETYYNSLDFNPIFEKNNREIYDQKKISILKKISATNNLISIDKNDEEKNVKSSEFINFKNNKPGISRLDNFMNTQENFINDSEENLTIKKNIDEEEKNIIDSLKYNKSDVDLISKKALLKCNYFKSKSDFNNKMIKSGNGKLMMTRGYSINDFVEKYKIPK